MASGSCGVSRLRSPPIGATSAPTRMVCRLARCHSWSLVVLPPICTQRGGPRSTQRGRCRAHRALRPRARQRRRQRWRRPVARARLRRPRFVVHAFGAAKWAGLESNPLLTAHEPPPSPSVTVSARDGPLRRRPGARVQIVDGTAGAPGCNLMVFRNVRRMDVSQAPKRQPPMLSNHRPVERPPRAHAGQIDVCSRGLQPDMVFFVLAMLARGSGQPLSPPAQCGLFRVGTIIVSEYGNAP